MPKAARHGENEYEPGRISMSLLNQQQCRARDALGNVLVSAGAGTGKTTAVVERCLRLIVAEECSLENILLVTFTEAAAAEMRERIRSELRKRSQMAPAGSALSDRLAQELALLDTALISTLHSFCLDLARRHFHELGMDPEFTVLDEQQTGPLIHETLEALFRRHYADTASRAELGRADLQVRPTRFGGQDREDHSDTSHSAAVCELVRRYGNGSDESIRRLVMKIHRHTQALADPQRWFVEQIATFQNPEPSLWRNAFAAGVADWAKLWRDELDPYASGSANVAAGAAALAALPDQPTFEQAGHAVSAIAAADEAEWVWGSKKKFRNPIEALFTDAAFLRESARQEGAALAEDWDWSRSHILTLLRLAREFTAAFTEAKRALGGIDFADQEQLALRLLYTPDGQLTSVAQACRARFRFVFVDECQDINAAQDAILRAVSRDGPDGNRFLVGDVKQSIYRFRLANPRIFQNYESRWKKAGAGGQFLSLSENFRSREALLQFINPLFRALMRPTLGGLHYDNDAELIFGNPTERAPLAAAAQTPPPGTPAEAWPSGDELGPRVEFHLISRVSDESDLGEGEAQETPSADTVELESAEREARLVAQRLKQLKEQGHRVWNRDRNCFEPVEYRDMVVLMRGLSTRAEAFAKAFHQAGVPLHAERAGFLDALEVTDLLNLLRLLDNPLQDVPLLAVLRSPLAGFSAEELVQVRLVERRQLLWIALRKLHARGPASEATTILWQKTDWFLRHWESWRQIIRQTSLSDCLEAALSETHYEALLRAGERGPARAANVRRFVDLARRFDPFQRQGLFRFLRFIAEQQEAEVRHEPAASANENAVRLMTIHQSKGLEFPIVVLAGLGNAFNFRDLQGDILLQEDFGLCPKVIPPGSRRRYPSITHWLAAQRERRSLLGEEMRLLYVALTRARDTLLLTGTARKKGEPALRSERAPITDRALATVQCYLDWLQLWLPHAMNASDWTNEREGQNALFRWQIHDPREPIFKLADDDPSSGGGQSVGSPPTASEVAAVRTRLEWRYPHAAATVESAKTSVSVLRRQWRDDLDDEVRLLPHGSRFTVHARHGAQANSVQLTAADIGTAHHRFLQFLDLARTDSPLDLRNEAERLRQAAILSPEEIGALDYGAIESFWQSEMGRRLRSHAERVQREMPFTARFSPADLAQAGLPVQPGLAADEFVVVQGVVDLAVVLSKEIWILDFKTDAVSDESWPEKARAYEPQLRLYASALERIYRRPVTQAWLHFLAHRRTVSIPLP